MERRLTAQDARDLLDLVADNPALSDADRQRLALLREYAWPSARILPLQLLPLEEEEGLVDDDLALTKKCARTRAHNRALACEALVTVDDAVHVEPIGCACGGQS